MQGALDLGDSELPVWADRLLAHFGDPLPVARRPPLGQLVKSIISSRTRDPVSARAYRQLLAACPDLGRIGGMDVAQVEELIAPVTFARDKAGFVVEAMARIGAERPGHDLSFLADMPVEAALAWLERLPGVARMVSATTLNASTLDRPVFIVDTHVARVLARTGFVDARAGVRAVSEAVTAARPNWTGEDFLRFHMLAKRLGQRVCRWDVAECGHCPLGAASLGQARCRQGAAALPA